MILARMLLKMGVYRLFGFQISDWFTSPSASPIMKFCPQYCLGLVIFGLPERMFNICYVCPLEKLQKCEIIAVQCRG